MAQTREKFVPHVNRELAAALFSLARSEGRQLQALADEAIADLIEKHKHTKPRVHVMGAYLASHEKFASRYQKLAK